MLQKVTFGVHKHNVLGRIQIERETVLVDAPDGDSAAALAMQAHAKRLRDEGALTDDQGNVRAAVLGIDLPTAEEAAAFYAAAEDDADEAPEPEPATDGQPAPVRRAGRPKGSKNRSRDAAA